ncbi:hypothetical protein DVH24_041557 [Malus domestica]|uniref:EDS1 EP domain-containing protein n=1 Tax=Malus domestica TaxID=3750 RepID=A0A498IB46_MALDO|nr:hypothetical protein DVH24_041557 [Malus domestica]
MPRYFILLEQWFNKDEEKKKAERENKEGSETKSNSKVKNVVSSLNYDSCFWIHFEEALILCNEQASNPNTKQKLIDFER